MLQINRSLIQLTSSMEWSTSCEANTSYANQEIPCLLCNLNVHYHVDKSLPLDPILSQMKPVLLLLLLAPSLLKISLNFILTCIPSFPSGFAPHVLGPKFCMLSLSCSVNVNNNMFSNAFCSSFK